MDSFHFLDLLCLATLDSDFAEALQINQRVTVAVQVLPLCQVLWCEMNTKYGVKWTPNILIYTFMWLFHKCNALTSCAVLCIVTLHMLCTQINVKLRAIDCVWIRYAIEGHFMFKCLKLLPSTLVKWRCVNWALITQQFLRLFLYNMEIVLRPSNYIYLSWL